jgi:hypothetical protein
MCILKGVQSIKSIHGIQALVWGGPIEYIAMKDADSTFATVMFFSVEACQKYFEATRNGIRLPDSPQHLVSVERVPGPRSVGDLLENCITVDGTRCVRACHADTDWGRVALMKLATGNEKKKREVEVIKSGTDSRGVS